MLHSISLSFPCSYLFFPSKHIPQAFTPMKIKTTASGVGSLFSDYGWLKLVLDLLMSEGRFLMSITEVCHTQVRITEVISWRASGFLTKFTGIQPFDLEACYGCNQRPWRTCLNEKWSLLELYAVLLQIFKHLLSSRNKLCFPKVVLVYSFVSKGVTLTFSSYVSM